MVRGGGRGGVFRSGRNGRAGALLQASCSHCEAMTIERLSRGSNTCFAWESDKLSSKTMSTGTGV